MPPDPVSPAPAPSPSPRPWAGKRFLDLLSAHTPRTALDRGRPLLRQGRVLDLVVSPGRVTADVTGNAATPLHVRISLGVFPSAAWDRAERRLAGEASRAAQLLSGEMPADIEEVFAACEVALFPSEAMELRAECSCTEPSDPCRHVAAVYLALARRFDEDPFLPLAWRGRTRTQLLDRLRAHRARLPEATGVVGNAAGAPATVSTSPEGPPSAAPPAAPPLPDATEPSTPFVTPRPASFWGASPLPPAPDEALPRPLEPDAVLREMGSQPFEDPEFLRWLATVYAAVADATREEDAGDP